MDGLGMFIVGWLNSRGCIIGGISICC